MDCCTCGCENGDVELLARFTTLIGESSFTTVPIDASGKDSLTVQAWRGDIQGGGTFGLFLEESGDAEHWSPFNAAAIDPGANTVKTLEVRPTLKWVRARVEMTGDAQVTCWAEGSFG